MVIKAVFQGGECNRPEKINDTRDLDVLELRMETTPWLSQEKQNVPVPVAPERALDCTS